MKIYKITEASDYLGVSINTLDRELTATKAKLEKAEAVAKGLREAMKSALFDCNVVMRNLEKLQVKAIEEHDDFAFYWLENATGYFEGAIKDLAHEAPKDGSK